MPLLNSLNCYDNSLRFIQKRRFPWRKLCCRSGRKSSRWPSIGLQLNSLANLGLQSSRPPLFENVTVARG